MEKSYDLQCRFDSSESFYNKARILEDDNTIKLYSYNLHVMTIDKLRNKIIYFIKYYRTPEDELRGKHSKTTSRHQVEFAKQNGFDIHTIRDIECIIKSNNINGVDGKRGDKKDGK